MAAPNDQISDSLTFAFIFILIFSFSFSSGPTDIHYCYISRSTEPRMETPSLSPALASLPND